MMVTTDTTDSRDSKAIAIAAGAHGWLKCKARDGSKRYGVPSQCVPGQYHLADQLTCTCYDARDNLCKHVRAVRLHVRAARLNISVAELVAMPAIVVVDGLQQMAVDRAITWESRAGADGTTVYLPRQQQLASSAAKYDDIFKRFEGD